MEVLLGLDINEAQFEHWSTLLVNDYAPYFYKTTDYGRTWTKITNGLPARGWAHVVREDPKNRNLLYAGTELGIYASFDGGARWTAIRNGLPPVQVRDLFVHPRDNDLVIGTHGRRGIGRVLLGSGAEQIIRHAPVPVLVVRGEPGDDD